MALHFDDLPPASQRRLLAEHRAAAPARRRGGSKAKQADKAALFVAEWQRLFPKEQPPVREFIFHPTRKWRLDVSWPDALVAVEIDGGTWSGGRHTRGKGFQEDCHKVNAAVALGWHVFRFTPTMLTSDPLGCLGLVRQALRDE